MLRIDDVYYMGMSNPLVSVAVIVYNSEKTLIETLDSIYYQTYKNIELIISDDCSCDNTLLLCHKWLETHENRFVRCEIITADKNSGVCQNLNRAERKCCGEWVKPIAGDDVLLPNCIHTYITYAHKNPNTIHLFSKVFVFGNNQNMVNYFKNTIFDYSFFLLPSEKQYEWLICRGFQPIPAATTFYNLPKSKELGLIWDERIPMLEDWPRWIQCLEKGVRYDYIEQELVKYRISETSICSSKSHSKSFRRSLALMYIYYQYKPAIKYKGLYLASLKYVHCKYIVDNNFFWHILDYLSRKLNRLFRRQDDFY